MDIFVARQPIFKKNKEVFGYELLYRSSEKTNSFNNSDGDSASSTVITSSFFVMNMNTLVNGKKAFVNFTENLLKDQIATILPKDVLVLEILETVEPSDEIIQSCKQLKKMGYTIALDDFVFGEKFLPLIEIADIIKIDFLNTNNYNRCYLVQKYASPKRLFLAEKIETEEDFKLAVKLGYSLFQGYFFSKPEIVSATDIPPFKFNHLQLMKSIYQSDPDFGKISKIIEKDVSLTFELLRLVNSVAFNRGNKITSISHAISLLGIEEIRKWVSLLSFRKISDDKPSELMKHCIVRAKFCELLAPFMGFAARSSELFLIGLFSMIDVLMNRPINEILADLPLSEDIKDALLNKNGIFHDAFDLVSSYERADWDKVLDLTSSHNIRNTIVTDVYFQSLRWVNEYFM